MADKSAPSQYRRAGAFAPGIGANLSTIFNKDVLLTHYSIDERPLNRRNDDDEAPDNDTPKSRRTTDLATIVFLTIAEDVNKPTETKLYHAWSDSLAQKIAQIPTEELPLLIKFANVRTGAGYNVITFE